MVVVSLMLASAREPAGAQGWPGHVEGRVQWIAGDLMVVQSDRGSSVSVNRVCAP